MVKGLLADVNCEGHCRLLLYLLEDEARRELWLHLGLKKLTFADLVLPANTPDGVVWQTCQKEDLVLITGNRNNDGPDSLEATIRTLNTSSSLPVFTIADLDRLMHERSYADKAADKLLEDLYDIDGYRGTGRVYIP